jgi:MinD superfamily P-loop ATPase
MQITIASGKGGTGKTTVATNLALAVSAACPIQFLDCDVEEPNAHIFLKPSLTTRRPIEKLIPQVDEALCTQCGKCATACEFNAIAVIGKKILVYNDLCHGCGLCTMVCPAGAITEIPHAFGMIEEGEARGFPYAQGTLDIGAAMATPIIHALKEWIDPGRLTIVDAPPGTGCPTIAAMKGADACILVTEPTPFGLHDLKAAVGVARSVKVPAFVVINRDGIGDDCIEKYCEEQQIPIAMRIPFDRKIADLYSRGITLVDAQPKWKERFQALYESVAGDGDTGIGRRGGAGKERRGDKERLRRGDAGKE